MKLTIPLTQEERAELLQEFPALSDEAFGKLEQAGLALTTQQRKIIAYKLQGMTNADAVIKARGTSGSRNSARTTGSLTLSSASGVLYMRSLANSIGLGDAALMRLLKQGVNAMRYELNPRTGEAVPMGPDWQMRWRFAQLVISVTGRQPDPKGQSPESTGATVVRATPSLVD